MEGVLSLNSRLGAVPGTALKRYGLFDSWKSLRSPYFVPGAVRIKEVQCARHHSAVTAFSGIDLPKGKPFCVSLRLRCPRPSQISPSKELFPFLVDKKRAVSKQKLSGIQPVQRAFDVPIPKAALLRSLFSSRFPCCCFLLLFFFFSQLWDSIFYRVSVQTLSLTLPIRCQQRWGRAHPYHTEHFRERNEISNKPAALGKF